MKLDRTAFMALAASAVAAPARGGSSVVWHVAIFRFTPEHVERAVAAFATMRRATRTHAGNLAYDVIRSTEDPGSFFIVERWASAADLAAHERTAVFTAVGRNVLERYAEAHDTVTGSPLQTSTS